MVPHTRIGRFLGPGLLAVSCVAAAAAQTTVTTVPTTRHAPDEFGTQDYTVTTIGAGSFTPRASYDAYPRYSTDTSFGRVMEGVVTGDFYSTVSIPAGAVIDYIGLESYCGVPAASGVQLNDIDRYGNVTPIATFSCTAHGYDTDYNSTAIGYQLTWNVHHLLMLDVQITTQNSGWGTFSWVEIWWKRSVSPPPASASFNDVPTNHPFFQFIEALKASGITAGCQASPPLYCPDAPLTRGQMAVFLSKALGLHWPY
jgi:hypothetical protein